MTTETKPAITHEEILAMRTPRGGYTRETLAKLGVPWPPPKGWLKAYMGAKRNAPTAAARRASDRLWSDIVEINDNIDTAEIIDAETGLPELIAAFEWLGSNTKNAVHYSAAVEKWWACCDARILGDGNSPLAAISAAIAKAEAGRK